MLSLSLTGRVFLYTLPTDMRKSFDSLSGLVEQQLGLDPLSGDPPDAVEGLFVPGNSHDGNVRKGRFVRRITGDG